MSTSDDESTDTTETPDSAPTTGIDDDQLPEDLQPGDDNPLAEGLEDRETVDDLMDGGKQADESDEDGGRPTESRRVLTRRVGAAAYRRARE